MPDTDGILAEILLQQQITNWLLDGRRGPRPEFTAEQLQARRRAQAEHLKRRRARKAAGATQAGGDGYT